MDRKSRSLQIGLILIGLACFGLAGLMVKSFSGRWRDEAPSAVAGPAPSIRQDRVTIEKEVPSEKKGAWVVYVTGAVKSPGVYRLPPESRVFHLIDSAGGLATGADEVGVNLAAPLLDGAHVHVPLKNEVTRGTSPSGEAVSQGSVSVSSLPSPVNGRGTQGRAGSMDLNGATKEELQSLPGIGPKTADSILAYRKENGPFRSVEELLKVKGIGPKKLESIKNLITVN